MIMIIVTAVVVQLLHCLCGGRGHAHWHQLHFVLCLCRRGCRELCIYTASAVIVDIIAIIARVIILAGDPSTDLVELARSHLPVVDIVTPIWAGALHQLHGTRKSMTPGLLGYNTGRSGNRRDVAQTGDKEEEQQADTVRSHSGPSLD